MKIKKILFYLLIFWLVFMIYKITYKKSYNFVALGDSLSIGIYPYGETNYSVNDHVRDYLSSKDLLNSYNNSYSKDGYKINDLKNDIYRDNNIKKKLRESDLVIISIGIDEISNNIKNNDINYGDIENIENNIKCLIKEIKKYAKNEIILIGLYNPYQHFDKYKKEIDTFVKGINNKYKEIANKNNIIYVDIFNIFDNNKEYLPNPINIHPNYEGYKDIYNNVKTVLDNIINDKNMLQIK